MNRKIRKGKVGFLEEKKKGREKDRGCIRFPVSRFHTMAVWSPEAVAARLPSCDTATLLQDESDNEHRFMSEVTDVRCVMARGCVRESRTRQTPSHWQSKNTPGEYLICELSGHCCVMTRACSALAPISRWNSTCAQNQNKKRMEESWHTHLCDPQHKH